MIQTLQRKYSEPTVGSVAKRVKAPFLWRPCDHNRVI